MCISKWTVPDVRMVENAIVTIEKIVIVETKLVQWLNVIVIVFLMGVLVQLMQSLQRMKTRVLLFVARLLVPIGIKLPLRGRKMATINRKMGVILRSMEGRDRGRVLLLTWQLKHRLMQVVRMVCMHLVMLMVRLAELPKKPGLPLHGSDGKLALRLLHPLQVQNQDLFLLREVDLRENVNILIQLVCLQVRTLPGGQGISLRICFSVSN